MGIAQGPKALSAILTGFWALAKHSTMRRRAKSRVGTGATARTFDRVKPSHAQSQSPQWEWDGDEDAAVLRMLIRAKQAAVASEPTGNTVIAASNPYWVRRNFVACFDALYAAHMQESVKTIV